MATDDKKKGRRIYDPKHVRIEIDGMELKGWRENPAEEIAKDAVPIEGEWCDVEVTTSGRVTFELEPDPKAEEDFYRFLIESGLWKHAGTA